jgi:hypothetical protein
MFYCSQLSEGTNPQVLELQEQCQTEHDADSCSSGLAEALAHGEEENRGMHCETVESTPNECKGGICSLNWAPMRETEH